MKHAVSFVAGLLFALGLGISGMTQPEKVIGFLDFFGQWDASLALVMIGAIGAHLIPTRLAQRRAAPVLDTKFHLAPFQRVDARLVIGAAIFGIGWGLGGYCPGPAVVASAGGVGQAAVFTMTMLAGFGLYDVAAATVRRVRAPAGLVAVGDG